MDDYYRIVGAERTASTAEIDRRSREQMRLWQSRTTLADLSRRQEAERRMTLLGEARTILLDATKRACYDWKLGRPPSTPDAGRETDPAAPSVAVFAARPAESSSAVVAKPLKRWYLAFCAAAIGLAGGLSFAGPEVVLSVLAVLVFGYLVMATPEISATRFRNRDAES